MFGIQHSCVCLGMALVAPALTLSFNHSVTAAPPAKSIAINAIKSGNVMPIVASSISLQQQRVRAAEKIKAKSTNRATKTGASSLNSLSHFTDPARSTPSTTDISALDNLTQ